MDYFDTALYLRDEDMKELDIQWIRHKLYFGQVVLRKTANPLKTVFRSYVKF